jgi:hypothetical protein
MPYKSFKRPHYDKLTHADLLLEENVQLHHPIKGDVFYSWTIDGYSEHQVLEVINLMLTYNTACVVRDINQSTVASAIVIGFTGQLYGWWHYYLSRSQRELIIQSIELNDDGTPNFDVLAASISGSRFSKGGISNEVRRCFN